MNCGLFEFPFTPVIRNAYFDASIHSICYMPVCDRISAAALIACMEMCEAGVNCMSIK